MISVRRLQCKLAELDSLPVGLTRDGKVFAIVLSTQQYASLCKAYRQDETQAEQAKSTHSQIESQSSVIPWYNPAIHVAGDLVRMRGFKGRIQTVRVPALDGDGHPMPV